MKTTEEKATEIRNHYNGVPSRQVSAGIYLQSVGPKFVKVLNTWGTTRIEKILIDDFYERLL